MTSLTEDRSDQMLRQSVSSARMAMAITDPRQRDNPIVFVNPAFCEMTGFAVADVLGRNCRFLQGAETDPAARAAIKEALSEERDIEIDLLNYRRNGEPFYNRLFISPVFDEQKRLVHYFASQLDVSVQKRSESINRRRENILRQISSTLSERLRTALGAVQAIVHSTLTSASSVVSAADDISAKLVSLGHVHDSLLKQDWDELEVKEVIEAIASSFPKTSERFQVSGPHIILEPLLSFHIAALVHDLCVGSVQHGALSSPGGRVRVTWSHKSNRSIELVWSELYYIALDPSDDAFRLSWGAFKFRGDVNWSVQRNADGREIRYSIVLDTLASLAGQSTA